MKNASIIEGYRTDAIAQVQRVVELIWAAGSAPDCKQSLAIGMAAELATEKIRKFGQLVGFAAEAEALTGACDGLDGIAA